MSDKNYESHWGENDLTIENKEFNPENPLDYSDILKFSICKNVLIKDCLVVGGKEDCIDIVRGEGYTIQDVNLYACGKNAITFKGAAIGLNISNLIVERHGSESDVELGQHSIYDSPLGKDKTKNIQLRNVTSIDGKPVIVKVWNAEKPIVTGGNVKVKVVPWPIVKIYFLFRWIQINWLKK